MAIRTKDIVDAVAGLLSACAEAAPVAKLQAGAELMEGAARQPYPVAHVYCDSIRGSRGERFRAYAGAYGVTVEVRASQSRIEALTERLAESVDAVVEQMERNRGCIAEGLVLNGKYEVKFEPVRRGGLGFLQAAKVTVEVEASRN